MKAERLMQLELLLLSHPEGMRRAEIARRLGVHRSTVGRYVQELNRHMDIVEDQYIIKLAGNGDMQMMKLSIYESLAFNLSAELLASHIEFQNPHLASGLRKIAGNMRKYAPTISQNIDAVAEAIETGSKKANPLFVRTLEVLTDSWVSGKLVKIIYHEPAASVPASSAAKGKTRKHAAEKTGRPLSADYERKEAELAPYFIGFRETEDGRKPMSVTGRLRHTTEIVTIDIQNILDAEILDEVYTIPDNLKPFRKPVTGEQYGGIDMIPLKLRLKERSALNSFNMLFREDVRTYTDDSGSLICEMQAENSIELMLRIIQSGDSVEILEPESYRKKFIREIEKILVIYKD